METPMVNAMLAYADSNPASVWYFTSAGCKACVIADELRALLAERDAWKAKAALVPPVRKLREVKGVTFDASGGDFPWRYKDMGWATLAGLIESVATPFTDADHAAIYALKDDPYEPVETLEDVADSVTDRWLTGFGICVSQYQRVQLGVLMCEAVRAWLEVSDA